MKKYLTITIMLPNFVMNFHNGITQSIKEI